MPVRTLRKFAKGFFLVLNCIIAVLYLLSCLVPYLNPSTWWFMGFLGLAFPYLVLLLIFSVFFWWVIKARYSILSIVVLLIGFKQLSVLFATHGNMQFAEKKDSSNIRIVDWNVRSFQGLSTKAEKKRIDRMSISDAILRQNPDVVCLQEFNSSSVQNNFALFENRYPYHYFSKDFQNTNKQYQSGSILFSKYPIIDSGRIKFPGQFGESLIYADVQAPGKVIRVFTTHMQSFKFSKQDYEGMEQIKEEQSLHASKSLFQKMKLAFALRSEQAILVRDALDKSPHASVICGDFNDVPNSYAYFHIKNNWQDAFLATSLGIGRTYLDIAPTLRIDYILPDPTFKITQFDMVDENLSDHLMLIADIGVR